MGNFFGTTASSPPPNTETLRQRLDRGWALIDQGKHAEAFDLFQGVLNEEPRNGEALGGRGKVYKLQRKIDEAILDLEKATQLMATHAWYPAELADAYDDAGKLDKAAENARESIRRGSKSAMVHAILGRYYLERKEWKDCEGELRQALNISPNYAWPMRLMANLQYETQQYGVACAFYREMMRTSPSDAFAHQRLTEIYLWKLDFADPALEVVKKWLELAPKEVLAAQRLVECYLRKKMPREAVEAARTAVAVSQNDPWSHCYLAKALRLDGQIDAAKQAVYRAIEIDPKNEHAQWLKGDMGA